MAYAPNPDPQRHAIRDSMICLAVVAAALTTVAVLLQMLVERLV